MSDERYEMASRLAADITAKAEELSTAIYEAAKWGYDAKVRVLNARSINENTFIGAGKPSIIVRATIPFDIGRPL